VSAHEGRSLHGAHGDVLTAVSGRHVIGFMSGNQQEPDMICEVFVLAPSDLIEDHELPARDASRA
jgi:hypothetical protein